LTKKRDCQKQKRNKPSNGPVRGSINSEQKEETIKSHPSTPLGRSEGQKILNTTKNVEWRPTREGGTGEQVRCRQHPGVRRLLRKVTVGVNDPKGKDLKTIVTR